MHSAKAFRFSIARASSTMTPKAAPLLNSAHNCPISAQIKQGHPAPHNSLDAASASRPRGARIKARSEFGPPKGITLLVLSVETLLRANKLEHRVEHRETASEVDQAPARGCQW